MISYHSPIIYVPIHEVAWRKREIIWVASDVSALLEYVVVTPCGVVRNIEDVGAHRS